MQGHTTAPEQTCFVSVDEQLQGTNVRFGSELRTMIGQMKNYQTTKLESVCIGRGEGNIHMCTPAYIEIKACYWKR